MGVLVVKATLVHLTIVHVEPSADLLDGTRIACFNSISRQMLGGIELAVDVLVTFLS